MATTAAVGIGVGAAAAAGATAAAIRAAKTRAKPRNTQYGGSPDAQDQLKQEYAGGIDQGNADYGSGVLGLSRANSAAGSLTQQGRVIASGAGTAPSTYTPSAGTGILGNYQPGQVAATQQQEALDQGALQNLGAARAGGALGLRNALVANAGSNVQAAQMAAAQRAQEQQAYVGAQVAQANNDQGAQMQAAQFGQQQMLQGQQVGLQAQAQGAGLQAQTSSQTGQLGLANQGQYLDQQQNVYDTQNANDVNYDTRRQQEQQRRSNNLWNFAGGLMGVAGNAFSMGMGGKGGGGGGGSAGG